MCDWKFPKKIHCEVLKGKHYMNKELGETNHIMATYALAICTWWPLIVENIIKFANNMMEMLLGHEYI
jgi:hypothetical protein